MIKLLKKIPWGIIAGFCGIIVFFSTAGVIAADLILSAIGGATQDAAGLFGTWYQVLLFTADVIFGVIFLASLAMFIWVKIAGKTKEGGIEDESVKDNI